MVMCVYSCMCEVVHEKVLEVGGEELEHACILAEERD